VSAPRTRAAGEAALGLALLAPLVREWFETASASSRLSYALLVPALALVLAWRARCAGSTAVERGGGLEPAFALAAAAALVLGALTGVFTLALLALPLALVAWTARWLGSGGVRRFAPSLVLLFAIAPPPMPLLDRVNPFLIQASGATAVTLLGPLDGDASWLGSTLSFRGWELRVAEACSGSGTFLCLGVLCAFLAALFRLRPLAALVLVASSFPLTLLVNGVRIASSALVIDRFGVEAAQGLAHELLGQAVVFAGAALLALAVERLSARSARTTEAAA